MLVALKTLQESYGRKIIILCTDGEDNASKATLKDLVLTLGSSAVTVFSISSNPLDPFSKQGAETLKKLTEAAGGGSFFYSNPEEIRAVMVNAGRAIRGQYSIGYYPTHDNLHGWRKLEVECRIPRIRLKYRKNYLF